MSVNNQNPELPEARVGYSQIAPPSSSDAIAESGSPRPSLAFTTEKHTVTPRVFRDALCVFLIAISDLIAVSLATAASFGEHRLLKDWLPLKDFTLYGWAESASFMYVVLSLGFLFRGLYLRREPYWETVRLMIGTCILSGLVMIAGLYVTKVAEATPRSLVVLAAANLILLSPLIRLSMIAVLRAFALWQVRAVVVGKEPSASQVAKDLEADWGLGYKVLRVSTGFTDRECLSGADEIVVVGSGYDPSTLNELVAEARWATGAVTFVPELSFLPIGSAASRFLPEKGHVLLTSRNLLTVRGNLILKRTFDLVISILILIPTVPVLVLIALAIRLSSRGPALYTQERVGKRGLRFRCMKFRTMHLDAEQRLASVLSSSSERQAEWNRYFKLRDDPRVTAIGRILRRTSLDELPQLLNILVGSMSLVGPRPLPDYHYAQIPEQWRSDYLDVLPGLTGAWQVSGRSETDLGQMGLLNSWYVRNWSLWLDITLLLRTIPVVLRGRGAY